MQIGFPRSYHECHPRKGLPAPDTRPLAGRKVMVDPGHGGSDVGAVGPAGGFEKEVNLSISLQLRERLLELGAEVRMTRDTDRKVGHPDGSQLDELKARVALANAWPAEIYVAVHANSNVRPDPNGSETYHSRQASQASRDLAAAVQTEMAKSPGFKNRGVQQADFHVLKNTSMPAILVETGFVSNPEEEKKLTQPEVQSQIAGSIAQGVVTVFGRANGAELENSPSQLLMS